MGHEFQGKRRRVAAGLAVSAALVACVTVLLLVPMPAPARPALPHLDKLVHATLYAACALPAMLVLPRRWQLVLLVVVLAHGGVIELIQPAVGRAADGWDMAANTAGAALALGLARLRAATARAA